jgi:CheY-like chemotaxis protein
LIAFKRPIVSDIKSLNAFLTLRSDTFSGDGIAVSPESKPRVLVIDDDKLIADSLSSVLNMSGFQSTAVYSGEHAVESAGTIQFDHLVSDVVMPGMSGIDTAIEVRKRLPQCKVLLMSGNNETSALLTAAQERGFDFDILPKPAHPSAILEKLRAKTLNPGLSDSPQNSQPGTE